MHSCYGDRAKNVIPEAGRIGGCPHDRGTTLLARWPPITRPLTAGSPTWEECTTSHSSAKSIQVDETLV